MSFLSPADAFEMRGERQILRFYLHTGIKPARARLFPENGRE